MPGGLRAAGRRTRLPDPFTLLTGLGLLAALIIVLGPALVGHGVLYDLSALTTRLPFRAVGGRDTAETILCRGDTTDYLPSLATIVDAARHGRLATWAPYEVGGATLAATPNSSWLTPIAWPYWVLPLWLAPAYVVLTTWVVGIGGTVLFLGRLGLSRAAGLLAGLCFVTGGFMVAWTNWPHPRVACLIPLLFWAVDRVVTRRGPRDAVGLGLVVAAMLLGGFPAVLLFAATLAATYAVVRLGTLPDRGWGVTARAVAAGAGGLVLGVGLAAVQLLPFVSQLGLVLADRDPRAHLPLGTALTMLAPGVRGQCVDGQRFGEVNPIEALGFVGAAALVLVVVGALRGRSADPTPRGVRAWLVASALVVAWLVWVGGLPLDLLKTLPFYATNGIGRAQSVLGFVLAALVGLGLDRLLGRHTRLTPADADAAPPRPARSSWALPLAVAVTVLGVVTIAQIADARAEGYAGHTLGALVVPLVLLLVAAAGAVLVLASRRAGVRRAGAVVLLVLLVGQNAAFAHTMLPTSPRAGLYPVTPTHRFLQQVIGHDRYGAGDDTMAPPTSDAYDLRTPVGHEFTLPRWKDLLEAADPDVMRSATSSVFSRDLAFTRSPVLDRLAVRWWVADPRQPVGRVEPPSSAGRVTLGPGAALTCTVSGGPLRGVGVDVGDDLPAAAYRTAPTLRVTVRRGDEVRSGAVLLDAGVRGGPLWVAVAGEDLPAGGRTRVSLRLTGAASPLVLAGSGDRAACGAVRPDGDADRVRLAHADAGGAVYERLDALPRIRWAARSRVVPDDQQVAALADGLDRRTVLLDDPAAPAAEGRGAVVSVTRDDPERMRVEVGARGGGYVVVADSIVRAGWTATLDGRAAPLVPADHALAAVWVPAGRHVVELRYAAPGLRPGLAVSLVALLVATGLCVLPGRTRRWASLVVPRRRAR